MSVGIFSVHFVNSGQTIEVPGNRTIFDVAMEHGLKLPIGCRYGGCITCAARLVTGRVRQPGATALNRWQSKMGFILLCVAKPRENCVIEEGVDVQTALFRNPFTRG